VRAEIRLPAGLLSPGSPLPTKIVAILYYIYEKKKKHVNEREHNLKRIQITAELSSRARSDLEITVISFNLIQSLQIISGDPNLIPAVMNWASRCQPCFAQKIWWTGNFFSNSIQIVGFFQLFWN
jgi:hypothetical protein